MFAETVSSRVSLSGPAPGPWLCRRLSHDRDTRPAESAGGRGRCPPRWAPAPAAAAKALPADILLAQVLSHSAPCCRSGADPLTRRKRLQ